VQEAVGRGRGGAIGGIARGCAPVPLSVLDLATFGDDTAAHALRTTTMLAQLVERRGFHRFWVAEHHTSVFSASSSPAVLMAHLAARTETIRLGSGGVILPNHAPLVVAEQFGMLEALNPGRIDMGVGRTPARDDATASALRRNPADFAEQLYELMGFLNGSFPADHPYATVHAVPATVSAAAPGGSGQVTGPLLWLLGTSERSGRLAGHLGLPFVFGYHMVPAMAERALTAYRESFTASAMLDRPYVMVSVSITTADSAAEAERLARLELGKRAGPPRGGEWHQFAGHVAEYVQDELARMVYGAPENVRDDLDQLVKETEADELMIISHVSSREPRLRVFTLIADIYGMAGTQHAG
jgi:luciferase family oxidoreductase group 1